MATVWGADAAKRVTIRLGTSPRGSPRNFAERGVFLRHGLRARGRHHHGAAPPFGHRDDGLWSKLRRIDWPKDAKAREIAHFGTQNALCRNCPRGWHRWHLMQGMARAGAERRSMRHRSLRGSWPQ